MYQNCESNQLKVKLNTFIVSFALNQGLFMEKSIFKPILTARIVNQPLYFNRVDNYFSVYR